MTVRCGPGPAKLWIMEQDWSQAVQQFHVVLGQQNCTCEWSRIGLRQYNSWMWPWASEIMVRSERGDPGGCRERGDQGGCREGGCRGVTKQWFVA